MGFQVGDHEQVSSISSNSAFRDLLSVVWSWPTWGIYNVEIGKQNKSLIFRGELAITSTPLAPGNPKSFEGE